jgi:hypothetical protein
MWTAAIVVPAAAQWIAGDVFAPENGMSSFAWFLFDRVHMTGDQAQFVANVVFRCAGAALGVAALYAALVFWPRPSRAAER